MRTRLKIKDLFVKSRKDFNCWSCQGRREHYKGSYYYDREGSKYCIFCILEKLKGWIENHKANIKFDKDKIKEKKKQIKFIEKNFEKLKQQETIANI